MIEPSTGNGSAPAIIVGRDLHKIFTLGDQQVHALNGVNIAVPQGQFIAIMGPSGSGKSTLLYLLGGLDRPTMGDILVAGRYLNTLGSEGLADFRRATVGFIFQAFHLVPTLTALENVALPIQFARKPRYNPEKRAKELLDMLGLSDRMRHRPSELSGGQQQRVAIARALANNPPLLLADEPTGNLDTESGKMVMDALRQIRSDAGTTVVIVTHDPNIASTADRVLTLIDGVIVNGIHVPA